MSRTGGDRAASRSRWSSSTSGPAANGGSSIVSPDGTTYVFKGRYLEVVAPEKLVNTFGMEGMFEGREIVETHTLEEVEGKTRYTSVSRFDSIADRDGMLASGMEEGARESLDRLAELLETLEPKV